MYKLKKQPIMDKELTGYASIDMPWMKYYGEDAKNDKIPKTNLYQYLAIRSSKHLLYPAINYYGKKITYLELMNKIDKMANVFKNEGIKDGDIVSICMPSIPEAVYTFFALNKLGAVVNAVDPRINPELIRDQINETDSKMVVTLDAVSPKIKKVESELKTQNIVTVSPNTSLPVMKKVLKGAMDKVKDQVPDTYDYRDYSEFKKNDKYHFDIKDLLKKFDKDKPALIVHTTGTTGKPKAAVLSNENILAMIREQVFALPKMKPGEKFLDIMPPFIAYGALWGMIIPLMAGLEVQMIPKFEMNKFDELLLKYKPPYMMGVPSFYEGLLKSEKMKDEDLSFLVYPIAGGNGMTPTSEQRVNKFFEEHNATCKILKGYGMTEVSSAISFPIAEETNKIGSVGIPLSKSQIKIMDFDTQKEVPYNVKGELWLSGPTVILGYLNNESENEKAFFVDENGVKWVKSGDVGYMDSDGCIFITGRNKRSIIRSDGHNVYPGEIENVLTMHDAVEQCCCVGAPIKDIENGVVATAYVVLKDEYKGYEPEIEKKLREFSSKYLQPRDVAEEYVFVDDIPLKDGKIDFMKVEQWAKEKVEKQKVLTK